MKSKPLQFMCDPELRKELERAKQACADEKQIPPGAVTYQILVPWLLKRGLKNLFDESQLI